MSVTFRRTNADTGVLRDSNSIQPTQTGDLITQDNLNRPSNNLRVRTEELLRAVESTEYIVQSSSIAATLLRYIWKDTYVKSGHVKVFYKVDPTDQTKYFYAEPMVPSTVESGSKPSIVIIGSSTNGFNYVVNLTSIRGYIQQGLASNQLESYNKFFGLSSPGDCIALRIPTVSSSYVSEVMLPRSTSSYTVAGESTLGATMLETLNTKSLSGVQSETSILKIPSKNSVSITATGTTADNSLLALLELAVASAGSTTLADAGRTLQIDSLLANGTREGSQYLDLSAIIKDGSKYTIPRNGYRSLEHLESIEATSTYVFSIDDNPLYQQYGSTVTVEDVTMLPKNEYLYPLYTYSGDAVFVSGLGSVSSQEVESRISDGGAVIDQSGTLIGEAGAAVRIFETRTNISYATLASGNNPDYRINNGEKQAEYFRLPIDINIPEAGAAQDIYLSKLEIHMVMGGSDQTIRGTKISVGMYDLLNATAFTSGSVKFSYDKCVNSTDRAEASLDKTILRDFSLKDFRDDYVAHVELQDSIRNTSALGKSILVWLYADTFNGTFFDPSDSGTFDLDFRFTYTTRVSDAGTGFMVSEDMDILHP